MSDKKDEDIWQAFERVLKDFPDIEPIKDELTQLHAENARLKEENKREAERVFKLSVAHENLDSIRKELNSIGTDAATRIYRKELAELQIKHEEELKNARREGARSMAMFIHKNPFALTLRKNAVECCVDKWEEQENGK